MNEELIKYETAKLAKEKGFNIFCDSCFTTKGKALQQDTYRTDKCIKENGTNDYYRPTQSLLQKWLREVKNIVITINHWTKQSVNDKIWDNCYDYNFQQLHHGTTPHKTYEEALEKGLQEALKLI